MMFKQWLKQFTIQADGTYLRRQLYLSASAFLFFLTVMFSMIYLRKAEESLSTRIAPQVLRFHVLANSDSAVDQELKLEVKQMLIDTMYDDLCGKNPDIYGGGTYGSTYDNIQGGALRVSKPLTKESIQTYIAGHKEELEHKAEEFMAEKGFSYSAEIQLESCYFPTKIYGDVVFPCGTYDAVRVLLGEGQGKNWWCVLYPPLCFTDNAYATVPDSSKEELRSLLPENDFRDLMKNRRVVFGDGKNSDKNHEEKAQVTVHVRSRLLTLLTERRD